MAVYTEVNEADLASFLGDYDLGHVLALKGIAEGVENSNYFLHADAGYFILTLYEKRVDERDLPFFLGLMEHLAGHGLNCPQPVKNRHGGALGRIAGRPAAIVTFLEGMMAQKPKRPLLRGRWRGAWQTASGRRRLRLISPQCLGSRSLAGPIR